MQLKSAMEDVWPWYFQNFRNGLFQKRQDKADCKTSQQTITITCKHYNIFLMILSAAYSFGAIFAEVKNALSFNDQLHIVIFKGRCKKFTRVEFYRKINFEQVCSKEYTTFSFHGSVFRCCQIVFSICSELKETLISWSIMML